MNPLKVRNQCVDDLRTSLSIACEKVEHNLYIAHDWCWCPGTCFLLANLQLSKWHITHQGGPVLWHLSSTLPEIDPDTAYVVCISVSLGFRQKPSDMALLSVIALTTFNCIVSASVTKGALICFVVTVHWWHHGTHYDVTEAYRVVRNILTVHLNNGAIRADLRGIPKHCEVTAKAGRQSTIYTGDFEAIFFIIRYGTNPCSYSGFLWARCSPWDIEQLECRAFGPRASLDRWSQLGRRRHTSIDK